MSTTVAPVLAPAAPVLSAAGRPLYGAARTARLARLAAESVEAARLAPAPVVHGPEITPATREALDTARAILGAPAPGVDVDVYARAVSTRVGDILGARALGEALDGAAVGLVTTIAGRAVATVDAAPVTMVGMADAVIYGEAERLAAQVHALAEGASRGLVSRRHVPASPSLVTGGTDAADMAWHVLSVDVHPGEATRRARTKIHAIADARAIGGGRDAARVWASGSDAEDVAGLAYARAARVLADILAREDILAAPVAGPVWGAYVPREAACLVCDGCTALVTADTCTCPTRQTAGRKAILTGGRCTDATCTGPETRPARAGWSRWMLGGRIVTGEDGTRTRVGGCTAPVMALDYVTAAIVMGRAISDEAQRAVTGSRALDRDDRPVVHVSADVVPVADTDGPARPGHDVDPFSRVTGPMADVLRAAATVCHGTGSPVLGGNGRPSVAFLDIVAIALGENRDGKAPGRLARERALARIVAAPTRTRRAPAPAPAPVLTVAARHDAYLASLAAV